MLAVLALLVAAGLLVAGWIGDHDPLVVGACVVAGSVVIAIAADRLRERPAVGPDLPDLPEVPESPESPEALEAQAEPEGGESPDEVVFVAGRTTFHRADCSSVRGRTVSRGRREDLQVGGMTACRTCLR